MIAGGNPSESSLIGFVGWMQGDVGEYHGRVEERRKKK